MSAASKAFALFNIIYQGGILLGPLVGLALMALDFRVAATAAAAVFAVLTAAQLVTLPQRELHPTPQHTSILQNWRVVLVNRQFLYFAAAMIGTYLLTFQVYPALPLQASLLTPSSHTQLVALMFAISGLIAIAGQLRITGVVATRWGTRGSLVVGVGILAASFLALTVISDGQRFGTPAAVGALLIAAALLAIGSAAVFPFEMNTVITLAGGRLVATHYGFYNTIVGTGILTATWPPEPPSAPPTASAPAHWDGLGWRSSAPPPHWPYIASIPPPGTPHTVSVTGVARACGASPTAQDRRGQATLMPCAINPPAVLAAARNLRHANGSAMDLADPAAAPQPRPQTLTGSGRGPLGGTPDGRANSLGLPPAPTARLTSSFNTRQGRRACSSAARRARRREREQTKAISRLYPAGLAGQGAVGHAAANAGDTQAALSELTTIIPNVLQSLAAPRLIPLAAVLAEFAQHDDVSASSLGWITSAALSNANQIKSLLPAINPAAPAALAHRCPARSDRPPTRRGQRPRQGLPGRGLSSQPPAPATTGRSGTIGPLSVPPSWATQAPTIRPAPAPARPGTSADAAAPGATGMLSACSPLRL